MIQISKAAIADAAQILDLQKIAYRSEAVLYNDWSIPPLIQTLDEIRKEFSQMTFLKGSDGQRIIGSVRGSLENDTCHIGRLVVHPEFQHKGIGTRLMAAIEEEFPAARRFELFTGNRSGGNIRLYERLGYRAFRAEKMSLHLELIYMEKIRQG